ncbi:MAG: peptidylprolyl isomerase [Elusimicrobiaceae bacterium]|nr:peptidylprolyl isomerase [Elusimicrobiaceae bacterium]
MKKLFALSACVLMAGACTQKQEPVAAPAPEKVQESTMPTNPEKAVTELGLKPGEYAVFQTEKGRIVAQLFRDKAPLTVENFTALANGEKEWTDPATGQKKKSRFYDGLTFMRVIPNFMIQGGDPLNNCTGGPGYKFKDEFNNGLSFDKPGILAMANSGPDTNGSQFFITDRPGVDGFPAHLNNRHTIFGEVVDGMDVVSAIARVPAQGGIAVNPVKIEKVEIVKIPQP